MRFALTHLENGHELFQDSRALYGHAGLETNLGYDACNVRVELDARTRVFHPTYSLPWRLRRNVRSGLVRLSTSELGIS